MIDAHWLNPPPTRDYGIFISPPEALSPSAPFGLSEEACRRSRKTLVWCTTEPSCTNFTALEIFPLIKLINGQETHAARGCELPLGHIKSAARTRSCTGRGGRNISKEKRYLE